MKTQRIALVTGANRGLGLETCRQLLQQGCNVILSSRDPKLGKEAAQKLKTDPNRLSYHPLDVTSDESCKEISRFVTERFGRLDILVNNAGILSDPSRHPPEEIEASFFSADIETIRKSMETNVYGAIRLIQQFVPLMRKNNYGRIVNLSSGMGQLSDMNGGWPGYRLSKVSLNAVTRIVADELQGTNVLINSVCPGWVKTRMGGDEAELPVEQGADTIVWCALLPDGGPSGGFFREREKIEW